MQSNHDIDEQLVPWIEAVKQQSPSKEAEDLAMDNVLKAIEEFDEQSVQTQEDKTERGSIWQWLTGMSTKTQLSFAGSFAIACVLSLGLFMTGSVNSPAFAAIQAQLKAISSMYYQGEMRANSEKVMNIEVFYRAPSDVRVVTTPVQNGIDLPSMTNVMDTANGKGLIIMPEGNIAVPFDFTPSASNEAALPDQDPLNWLSLIRGYEGEVITLDSQYINGIEASGYQINVENMQVTLWVNPETELPVKLLLTSQEAQSGGDFVFEADLRFNQYLEDELFDVSASGYQIAQPDA